MPKRRLYNCALCNKSLAEQRPVFLMIDSTQEIRGPLHAGCAESIHIDSNRALTWQELQTDSFGRVVPKVEQLPLLDALEGDQETAT